MAGPAQDLAWALGREFAVEDYELAVYENVIDAFGVVVGVVEGCYVRDCGWVKDGDIRNHVGP